MKSFEFDSYMLSTTIVRYMHRVSNSRSSINCIKIMSTIVYHWLLSEATPKRHFLRPFPTVPEQEVRQCPEEVSARALATDGVGLINVDLKRKVRGTPMLL